MKAQYYFIFVVVVFVILFLDFINEYWRELMDADIQTVEVTGIDAESRQMEMMAKLAAQQLTNHYPNHVWMVGWAPGMTLIIKYMGANAKYGYTVDAAKAASISELERAIVMGGGELLERLGMKRGAWDGELPNQEYAGIKEVT